MRSISSRLRGALETRAASARYQRSIAAALAIGSLVLALPARPVRAEADGPDFYRVTGVAADDVLNIRSGPSAKDAVVGTVPPNGDGMRNLGCSGGMSFAEWEKASAREREAAQHRRWCKVEYKGVTGWVAGRFLAEGSGSAAP